MNISFTNLNACEYWLLDIALTRYISTGYLLLDSYGGMDVPPFVTIFSEEEIVSSLIKLFKLGYLLGLRNRGDDPFIPNEQEIKEALCPKKAYELNRFFLYFLTSEGGKKWESLSNPNWNTYTTLLWDVDTDEQGINEAAILAVEQFWLQKRLNTFFAEPNLNLYDYLWPRMIGQSISKVIPYQPIYWKTFEECYCIKFNYELVEQSVIDSEALASYRKNMINEPATSLEIYWYTHPYEHFHSQAEQALKNI
ncbi:MAG: hypothetical protein ACRC2S_27670 [Waterburya sp.]